jgi:rRNA-processing protein FCF1
MKKILLDTNFLIAPFQFDFDVLGEFDRLYGSYQLYTLDDAVQEAKSIEEGKYKDLVDKLLETQDIEVLETVGEGEVDDLIVDVSEDFAVATNDRELKERLIDKEREVVIVRGGNHLEKRNSRNLL